MTQNLIIMALLSLFVSSAAYPFVLRYALRHKVVDNPDARKIHRRPMPVMGSLAVYAGIFAGCVAMSLLVRGASIHWALMALTTMLVLGVWDDIKNLSAVLRFMLQMGIVGGYIALTGNYIWNFHGLFGQHELSLWLGIPLSLVAGVGIINAINMIDGIDGYSSGYVIMSCSFFAALFLMTGQHVWSSLAVIVVASLIPFFMHNVFGVKSKMFVGDGGTMMLGFIMTIFVLGAFSLRRAPQLEGQGVSIAAMTLAVMCIPVFDTLRVMTARMFRGRSPFKPDKTHLHHLFIDMGFSHLGAAMAILSINFVVILVWLLLWQAGVSIDMQTYIVVLMGVAVTFGFYRLMRWHQHNGPVGADGLPQGTALWRLACRAGQWSHKERGHVWLFLRKMVDGRLLRRQTK
ncbi:MAG: undecaprenyl/decaprenyl-phosphate alpha-N-acetylglucosaminyl 1-phosphate transferase [Prevotella sp.]|nr:undecaprenyl/decaprenyl-phosphate alpha-N-acetylglucosaminyl 1-phosphate transferase [Prevotella sp.]